MKRMIDALVEMFPFFLNKNETSNFFKSQEVSSNQFKNIYSDLTKVYDSFHLDKRCLIWREQSAYYEYKINFSVSYFAPLKSVKCYKNDTEIYSGTFLEEEEVYDFTYIYEGDCLNEVVSGEAPYITNATFSILVEGHDGNIIRKGYPENDEIKGDIFDHDTSLDRFGKLYNLPRREYLEAPPDLYPATYPPFCNSKTEEDYYYMKRIIEYMMRYHVTPLPVLEIWKMYHIDSTLENRQKLLLKTFDETRHDTEGWSPEVWEHKDRFCDYSQYRGVYFFIEVSTNTPTRKQIVDLKFMLVDSYGNDLRNEDYLFDIYLDNELISSDYTSWIYKFSASQLSDNVESIILVNCKNTNNKIVSSVEIAMRARGCMDANLFVSPNGSDSNDGLTTETPLKTIQKACNKVIGGSDLIAVLEGTYTTSSAVKINKSCFLMGCGNVTLENTTDNRFFKLGKGKELSIQDINLEYNETSVELSDEKYTNKNAETPIYVIAGSLGLPPFDPLPFDSSSLIKNLEYSNGVISYDPVSAWTIEDLTGVIYDLTYEEGVISYSEFEASGNQLTPEELSILERAVKNITYEGKIIKYEVIGEINYD